MQNFICKSKEGKPTFSVFCDWWCGKKREVKKGIEGMKIWDANVFSQM